MSSGDGGRGQEGRGDGNRRNYLLFKRLMSLTRMVKLLHKDEGRNQMALVWCEREFEFLELIM
jgi:hypothetical protein